MPKTELNSPTETDRDQTNQNIQYAMQYPHSYEDDTIDFYELWITLWSKRWYVIGLCVLSTLLSVTYALRQPSIYRAETLVLPPKLKEIQTLYFMEGVSGTGQPFIKSMSSNSDLFSPESVFLEFKKNLSSRNLQKKFINSYGLMEVLAPERTSDTMVEYIYQIFTRLLDIRDVENASSISISIELNDPITAAQWVNDYVKFINDATINQLMDQTRFKIDKSITKIEQTIESKKKIADKRKQDKINAIERTIKSKREMTVIRRNDKIVRYEEAAKIAKTLGIKSGHTQLAKFADPSAGGVKKGRSATEQFSGRVPIEMNVEIATATTPLFYLGYDAIKAELDNLKNREDEDPFIPGLRDLQEQLRELHNITSEDPLIEHLRDYQENLALLKAIKINPENLSAMNIDQEAFPPKNRIKPNRRRIVFIGTAMGLILGISLVFMFSYVMKLKKSRSK